MLDLVPDAFTAAEVPEIGARADTPIACFGAHVFFMLDHYVAVFDLRKLSVTAMIPVEISTKPHRIVATWRYLFCMCIGSLVVLDFATLSA